MLYEKAKEENKKRAKNLKRMIEVSEEMIPRKNGILSPKHAVTQSVEETKTIVGQPQGEVMSNKYLKRIKDFVGDNI